MRIVHTSDWHTGAPLRSIDRTAEVEAALDGMARYIERENVDLVLMTGDIFHAFTPSADSERVVFQFLKRVGAARVPSVVIAGNHDSAHRVQAWAQLAELALVHAYGTPRPADRGGVLEIPTKSGELAVVASVPFATPMHFVTALDLAKGDVEPTSIYRDLLTDLIARLATRFRPDAVNVLAAHVHIQGAVLAKSTLERHVVLGEQWAVTGQSIPSTAQYVALGHIHKPQQVAAPAPTVYAGSVLQLDFGEAGEEKSFVVVDVSPKRPARLERIPYEGTKPLARITKTLSELEREAETLKDSGWLEVTVPLERPDPAIAPTVRALVPNAVVVQVKLPEQAELAVKTRQGLSPRQLYAAYVQQRHGFQADEALLNAFEALLTEAEQAELPVS
jgi:exonuclease SbcD